MTNSRHGLVCVNSAEEVGFVQDPCLIPQIDMTVAIVVVVIAHHERGPPVDGRGADLPSVPHAALIFASGGEKAVVAFAVVRTCRLESLAQPEVFAGS